eukprot:gene32889-40602_t
MRDQGECHAHCAQGAAPAWEVCSRFDRVKDFCAETLNDFNNSENALQHNEYDDNAIVNPSPNLHMNDLLAIRLSRRQTLKGGVGVTATALLGGLGLSACGGDSSSPVTPLALGFAAVAKNKNDVVTVPEGYQVSILHALGDPMHYADSSWQNNGSETADSYNRRIGDGHDGMYYF